MAESIGESGWKAFTKKQKLELDDAAFLKALAKFDKTDASRPEPRVEALEGVVEQGNKLVLALAKKKKELGDKPFNEAKDKLHEFIEGAERLMKEARAAAEGGDEEADSPALLNAKMIPLIRELRKGGATMHALIATAGKNTAVLIMRRAISPSRRTLLADAVDAKGGAKFIPGEVTLEEKVLTFIVKSPAAGLAKRIRMALHLQTDLRLKVRVRGEDGEADEDGEDDGQAEAGTETPTTSGGDPEASAAELAWRERERALAGPLEAALAAHHPESTKLRAVSGFASEKAAAGDFAAALRALDVLEATIESAPGGTRAGTPEAFSKVVFEQVHLRWDARKKTVQARLDELRQAILDDGDDEEDRKTVGKLTRVLARFNLGLGNKLDELRQAETAAQRQTLAGEARRIAETYLDYIANDELVRHVEANPYEVAIGTQALLGEPLQQLQAELDKVGL